MQTPPDVQGVPVIGDSSVATEEEKTAMIEGCLARIDQAARIYREGGFQPKFRYTEIGSQADTLKKLFRNAKERAKAQNPGTPFVFLALAPGLDDEQRRYITNLMKVESLAYWQELMVSAWEFVISTIKADANLMDMSLSSSNEFYTDMEKWTTAFTEYHRYSADAYKKIKKVLTWAREPDALVLHAVHTDEFTALRDQLHRLDTESTRVEKQVVQAQVSLATEFPRHPVDILSTSKSDLQLILADAEARSNDLGWVSKKDEYPKASKYLHIDLVRRVRLDASVFADYVEEYADLQGMCRKVAKQYDHLIAHINSGIIESVRTVVESAKRSSAASIFDQCDRLLDPPPPLVHCSLSKEEINALSSDDLRRAISKVASHRSRGTSKELLLGPIERAARTAESDPHVQADHADQIREKVEETVKALHSVHFIRSIGDVRAEAALFLGALAALRKAEPRVSSWLPFVTWRTGNNLGDPSRIMLSQKTFLTRIGRTDIFTKNPNLDGVACSQIAIVTAFEDAHIHAFDAPPTDIARYEELKHVRNMFYLWMDYTERAAAARIDLLFESPPDIAIDTLLAMGSMSSQRAAAMADMLTGHRALAFECVALVDIQLRDKISARCSRVLGVLQSWTQKSKEFRRSLKTQSAAANHMPPWRNPLLAEFETFSL